MIQPTPTKTGVIDAGKKCNCLCKGCYFAHLGDLTKQTFRSKEALMADIDKEKSHGMNYADCTGGEGTIHPDMPEIIRHATKQGMRMCIITNALCGKNTTQKLLDAGIDEFLVSVHGRAETHDKYVQYPDARKKQERFLEQIHGQAKLRFNTVINRFDQSELYDLATWMLQWRPSIVNFINFNPHSGWKKDLQGTRDLVADLRLVEPVMNEAIFRLEAINIGVNVRYYPMCRIKEEYRRCICNDLHVEFDNFEWRYIVPRDFHSVRQNWIAESKRVEEKRAPCNVCDLQWICGGANRWFHQAATKVYGEPLTAITNTSFEDRYGFYHYRQHNVLTLGER